MPRLFPERAAFVGQRRGPDTCRSEKACKRSENAQPPPTFIKLNYRLIDFQPKSPDRRSTGTVSRGIAAHAGRLRDARQDVGGGADTRAILDPADGCTEAKANDIRSRRARLKRDLKAGRAQIHGLLLNPPEYLETAKVFDLLLAVPKYGRVKVNRILTHCRISPSKTIGGLSERQRNELVSYLRR